MKIYTQSFSRIISLICIFSIAGLTNAQTQTNDYRYPANFITLSDIHFNPFYDCDSSGNCQLACELSEQGIANWDALFSAYDKKAYPQYGEETNYHLLTSTLTKLQSVAEHNHPDFAIVLGDFLAHRFSGVTGLYRRYTRRCDTRPTYEEFVTKVMRYLSLKIYTALPNIPIYSLLGNNDSATGNYSIDPGGYFLKQVQQDWLPLIQPEDEQQFQRSFVQGGGYYHVSLDDNLRLIVLNSVLFSSNASVPQPWYLYFSKKELNSYASQQMVWLENQLKRAQELGQQILIAYHVPVGIDIFKSLGLRTKLQWRDEVMQQFVALVERYQSIIVGQLGSHVHTDGLYLIRDDAHKPLSYIITTPSISPIYNNNPGFKVYAYQPSPPVVTDFTSYYLDVSQDTPLWQLEYTFSASYGAQYTPITAQTVHDLFSSEYFAEGTSTDAVHYQEFFALHGQNNSIDKCWQNYWCGMMDITSVYTYRECVKS